ncbi:MAG: hypothetical protein QG575_1787 [Euryarchaeota archaeon]|nr:hypothetical protein [Euryarchaeota archaeon]
MLFALDGGIDLKKAILTVLVAMVLVALTGCSMADVSWPAVLYGNDGWTGTSYVNGYEESNRTFDFEQSVQGNGYFVTYLYAKAGAVAVKNYAHGSGSLNSEATLTYQNLDRKTHNAYSDYNDFAQDCIMFKEDVAMVYAPMRIAVGTGYYAANPLEYASLLKEKTWVKNYLAGTSMHHEVEYAHALDKELEIVAKDKFNYTYDPELESVGYTQMKLVEDVTDGKAHIGVLQANDNFASQVAENANNEDLSDNLFGMADTKSAWKNPSIEIDEDYWGTYHIEKNMTLEVPYHLIQKSDDWLPCCFGGYLTMPTGVVNDMRLKGAKGVFDCTCFKAPAVAEFPRTYPVL